MSQAWLDARPDLKRDKDRRNKRRRRRAKQGASFEKFDDLEIFDRDEWRCGLCGEPVDAAVRYPDPRCASLDHVVPLSRYGHHTRSNSRLAHFDCNRLKGDRIDEEVAHLFVYLAERLARAA